MTAIASTDLTAPSMTRMVLDAGDDDPVGTEVTGRRASLSRPAVTTGWRKEPVIHWRRLGC